MSLPVQGILQRCVITIQDNTSVRWTIAELVRYFNDGQREVILFRPDAMTTYAPQVLVAGTRQTIPAMGTKLIDVLRNTSGNKRSIRQVNREILDAQTPGWHGLAGVTEINHFVYDPRDPKVFYVYPPAAPAGASVDLIFSALPVDIAEPADGLTYTAVVGNMSVPDIYANVLQDYVLYRAYLKDAEYAGNGARSQMHRGAFDGALGVEIKATIMVGPTSANNPNTKSAGASA